MPPGPVYLASDAHLGAAPPAMEAAFLEWLAHAGRRASLIFLNGDLFDFWFEWGSVVPGGHARVLGELARITDAGIPVHLMGGNHDWWGGRYLTGEIGLTLHRGPVRIRLAGHECLVAHGDGLGGGDLGYRLLRRLLRSRVARRAVRLMHPDFVSRIARRASRTEAHAARSEVGRTRGAALERWARERLAEEEALDAVILGHCHLPAEVEVAPGRFYLNAGDWLSHATYLILDEGRRPALMKWPAGRR
ncbi:MAG: UDP-2,3-diacylglucosamine diphosphatase [Gammaproteobacteria bacterium]|nr:UDP-2,3-diacylglucosamine diphosphatase [Gammaproteobacteria bacterium]MDE0247652.1 UDP-2,3-diacylglucosamine diphosphatase [Gammaproteobacteria bacterium]